LRQWSFSVIRLSFSGCFSQNHETTTTKSFPPADKIPQCSSVLLATIALKKAFTPFFMATPICGPLPLPKRSWLYQFTKPVEQQFFI
jgi:hypothetical protein